MRRAAMVATIAGALVVAVPDPAASQQTGPPTEELDDADRGDAFRLWNLVTGPVCRDPELVEERREKGQPTSDRICEGRDVLVRGEDVCIWSGEERACTWWGFEFDYENADPAVPMVCDWTRSRPADEGNYEGVRQRDAATGTMEVELEAERGHYFSPGYDLFLAVPWLVVDVRYDCTYRGEPAFEAEYRLVFSSAFRR